jgi:hypothetical protein
MSNLVKKSSEPYRMQNLLTEEWVNYIYPLGVYFTTWRWCTEMFQCVYFNRSRFK